VYLGLAQYVAGALDLSSWSITWGHAGLTAGWLAVVAALLALSLWLAGVLTRRSAVSDLYAQPCLNWSLALTMGGLALALDARFLLRDAYRFGLAALVLNAAVTMFLARSWRRAELTYAAVFHVVAATYLVLFSVGTNDPAMAYVLGLSAVIEAIVLWAIGFALRRWGDDWARSCARALFHATVALAVLGIPLADGSPVTLVLAALCFLLTVQSLARAEWLYATVAALGLACYDQWLWAMSPVGVIEFAMGAAFALWAAGVLVQRVQPVLGARLGLPRAACAPPLFHSSILVGLIALGLRLMLSLDAGLPWTAQTWFPLSLSLLALVMLKAYPRREWVHVSLMFLVWSVISVLAPSLTSPGRLAMAGMVVALGLLLLERLARVVEPALCARLGVVDANYAPVVKSWAAVLFVVPAVLTIAVVLSGMSAAIWGAGLVATSTGTWWPLLVALGLAAAYLVAAGMDPEGWGDAEPDVGMIGLLWIGVLAMWWLGVAASPLMGGVLTAAVYYPAATAVAALATVQLGRRYADLGSWHELSWLGDVRSERSSRLMAYQGCILAVLAALFSQGTVTSTTVATLGLSALALGLGALVLGSPVAAGLGSAGWAGAGLIVGQLAARWLGFATGALTQTCGAAGAIVAAFSLWWLAGGLRLAGSLSKPRALPDSEAIGSLGRRIARVMEALASGTAIGSAALVLAAAINTGGLGTWGTSLGVGVILLASLLHIVLVPRWQSEGLVYLAQGLMVAAYIDFRLAFPLPMAGDAAILTLLGYLDLGLAEVLERLPGPERYVRPTRYFSLALPLLPVLQLLWSGVREPVSLFYLLAAATFYSVACSSLRWKSLGYAAAVFTNAALWVYWSRLGWMLADHPQFFLIPVGLSAILFAEVNRELGRSAVNAIRSIGLIIIYVSLAVPIWQFESFGAWLTLLLGSLLGVFVGIGLRLQTFLWLGLTTFVLDVVYEMGRVSLDYAFAKWAIMLVLGIALFMFVALNEKKRILETLGDYYERARQWE
jgi:hypothetical protein